MGGRPPKTGAGDAGMEDGTAMLRTVGGNPADDCVLGVGARRKTGAGGTDDRGAGVPRRDGGPGVIDGPRAVLVEDPASGPGDAAAAAMRGGIPVRTGGVGAKEESRRAREMRDGGGA